MKLHGHARLELTDVHTVEVEVVEFFDTVRIHDLLLQHTAQPRLRHHRL